MIPLHIYQLWHNKEMPPVKESIQRLKEQNSEFEHLYDEAMSRLPQTKFP